MRFNEVHFNINEISVVFLSWIASLFSLRSEGAVIRTIIIKQMIPFSQQSTVLVLSGETKAVETIRLYPLIFLCSLYPRSLFLCYKTRTVNLVHSAWDSIAMFFK